MQVEELLNISVNAFLSSVNHEGDRSIKWPVSLFDPNVTGDDLNSGHSIVQQQPLYHRSDSDLLFFR